MHQLNDCKHPMTSLTSNYGNKRKRNQYEVHIDDETSTVEIPTVAGIDESSSDSISFLEFRHSTVDQYTSLNWLGPGVMAVYWFKEYLKKAPFDWVRRPKQKQISVMLSSSSNFDDEGIRDQENRRRQRRLRQRQTKSKGNFYFIPGQYLKADCTIATAEDLAIQNVIDFGTPGIHYATSYIGVYNLLRSYGKFVLESARCPSNKNSETEIKIQSSRMHSARKRSPKVVLSDYQGPLLPNTFF